MELKVLTVVDDRIRLEASSAMDLLKQTKRQVPVEAWSIISRVEVLPHPARARIIRLDREDLTRSRIVDCSVVGVM